MLTYYYDEPTDYPDNSTTSNMTSSSESSIISTVTNTLIPAHHEHDHDHHHQADQHQHSRLTHMDHAANPALVHHLYLGLSHMGKNAPYPTSIILFFIFTLVVVFSMIILLLIMVSVSVTCNDSESEEKLLSNMEANQGEDDTQFDGNELKPKSRSERLRQFIMMCTGNLHSALRQLISKFWNSVNICLNALDTKTYHSIQ